MKSTGHRLFRKLLLPIIVCGLIAEAALQNSRADDRTDSAQPAAQAWLRMIDAGEYDESYDAGSDVLRGKVPRDTWVSDLKTLRPPWGDVVTRRQISHIYKPNGFEGVDGEFMVITYDISFKNLASGREVIVLRWEGDRWRGAGYIAGAKPIDLDPSQPPPEPPEDSQTEVTSRTVHQ